MRVIRTLSWIVITAIVVAFIAMNWNPRVVVRIWPLADDSLVFNWPVGIVALVFFLLGLVPMWLLHKAGRWQLKRRIAALENTVKATSAAPPPPLATSTQIESENAALEAAKRLGHEPG